MDKRGILLNFLRERFPEYNINVIHAYTTWLTDISLPLDDLSKRHRIVCKTIAVYSELIEPLFQEVDFIQWLMLRGDLPKLATKPTDKLEENFAPHEFLGKGTYGTVISGTYCGNRVALKQFVEIERSTAPKCHDPWHTFAKECAILSALNKKCGDIVGKIHGSGWYKNTWCMILERHHIKSMEFRSHESCTSDSMKDIIRQLFRAIDMIHTHIGYIHGDIKPDNVMIDFVDEMCPRIKIIDFGLSQPIGVISENQQYIDTIFWRAPELLAEEECELVPTDVWAAAITAIDIIIGTYSIYLLGAKNDMEPGEIYGILTEYCLDDEAQIPVKWTKYIHADLLDFAKDIFNRYVVFADKRAGLKDLC